MTQKEIHNQRLQKEAEHTALQHYTRRHFLKESAMGLGALALGSFFYGLRQQVTGSGKYFL